MSSMSKNWNTTFLGVVVTLVSVFAFYGTTNRGLQVTWLILAFVGTVLTVVNTCRMFRR